MSKSDTVASYLATKAVQAMIQEQSEEREKQLKQFQEQMAKNFQALA